jgi:anaphase-promoting complex subunit 3
MGRAHTESLNHAEAERCFAAALTVEPHRLAGHELHSTLLWHLRAEVRLCCLAQHAVTLDRQSAATWTIVGNCFSLQKEHDTALRFLKRVSGGGRGQ